MVSDYLYRKAAAQKVPLAGTFELSPVCNFTCKMCYVRKTPEQLRREGKELIPWQQWLELAEQCREAGTLYLLLTGGEPFLYPGFRELYTQLHRMGFLISINSNGTLIDEETVAWLKTVAPTRINITLYGTSPETYRRICGNSTGYERTMNAITMLKDAGIPVVINASMIPENACDLEEIAATGRSLGLNTRISTYMFPPIRREREEADSRFTPEESADMFMRRIRCQMPEEEYRSWLQQKLCAVCEANESNEDWGSNGEYMRCRAGRSAFWINWDGTMTACAMVDFPLKTQPLHSSFRECWTALTEQVRRAPVLAGCASCEKRELCKPCVAMIHAETGTVDEKAPYLCCLADAVLKRIKEEAEETDHE